MVRNVSAPTLVTGLARQTAFLGPAAVAVHDYRNMTRHRTVFGRVILLFRVNRPNLFPPCLSLLRQVFLPIS